MHWYWQDLLWDCFLSFFCEIVMELWPLIEVRFRFRSISLESMDRIWPDFIYVLILTRSRFGLLPEIFRKFVKELWPLIDVRFLFSLNIFRTNGQNFIKFCKCFDIDKIWFGIVTCHFSQICKRVKALDVSISFPLNIFWKNGQNLTKFFICIDIDKILVGISTQNL